MSIRSEPTIRSARTSRAATTITFSVKVFTCSRPCRGEYTTIGFGPAIVLRVPEPGRKRVGGCLTCAREGGHIQRGRLRGKRKGQLRRAPSALGGCAHERESSGE